MIVCLFFWLTANRTEGQNINTSGFYARLKLVSN